MDKIGFDESREQTEAGRDATRGRATELGRRFLRVLEDIRPGAEDPVLAALAGDELAEVTRRTGWSTLVINPGSTSTKVAVFSGLNLLASDEVEPDPGQPDGAEERARYVVGWMKRVGLDPKELSGIASRGGFVSPVPTGTYRVTKEMCGDLGRARFHHASNLSVPIALAVGELAGPDVVVTITDPVSCDEVDTVFRITGSTRIRSDGAAAHYLNLKAVCRLFAHLAGVSLGDLHLAACQMGGGMSAVRCLGGRMAQVVHAFGNMPSANRAGSLPLKEVLELVEDGDYSLDDLKREVTETGAGLLGLCGTADFKKLFDFRASFATAEQARKIDLVVEFFARRIAAHLLELSATDEPLDAFLLTGGLARSELFCERIAAKLHVSWPTVRVPGSVESEALAAGLLTVLADQGARPGYGAARDALAARRAEEDRLLDVEIFSPPGRTAGEAFRLRDFDELIEEARPAGKPPAIAIAGADNEEALLAAKLANEEGGPHLARFVLIGPHGKVSQLAWELDLPVDEESYFVVDAADPVERALELFDAGIVQTLMKGSVTTAALLKGYFSYLKRKGATGPGFLLSHLGLFEVPGRPKLVAISDAAINPNPDLEARLRILDNAVAALHALGLEKPKVAVISATETSSDKVVSSMEAKEIAARRADRADIIIEGPLSVDLSLSPISVREKGYKGRIQGDADLLLVPTLDVGNAIYKTFTVASGASVAGVVIGGEVPLILTSRGDSSRSKLASIALALVLAKRGVTRS